MKKMLKKLGMIIAAILVSIGVYGRLNRPSEAHLNGIYQEEPYKVGDVVSIVGDMGTGERGQFEVSKSIAISHPVLVKTVGDNIYENSFQTPKDPDFINKFLKPYQDLKTSFEITLGNHCWYSGDPITAWSLAAKDHPWIKWRGNYYAIQRGRICELHLDTELFDNPGLRFRKWAPFLESPASEKQLNWIKAILPKLQEQCGIIVGYGHHPYLNPGKSHGDASGEWEEIFRTVLAGKIHIYIAGHEHILADEGSFKGTRLLISGAGGKIEDGLYRAPVYWASETLGHLDLVMKSERQFDLDFYTLSDGTVKSRHLARKITVNF